MDPYIVAAVIGAVPATLGAVAAWRSSKKVGDAVQTNHGKRPGEYLELIGDIHKLLVDHITDDTKHLS